MRDDQGFPAGGRFIVDNDGTAATVLHCVGEWCQSAAGLDVATGHFEVGALLGLGDHWPRVRRVRVLMGDPDVSLRTRAAFDTAVARIARALDASIEDEKARHDFPAGLDAVAAALRGGQIVCRVYRKERFHAKAYIARDPDQTGAAVLVGSSNFTVPGVTRNVELNVRHAGPQAAAVADWFDRHWADAEDVTADMLRVVDRHIRPYSPFEVYAKSLYELFLDATPGEQIWEEQQSRMFKVLDGYQQDGYRNLINIARDHNGALLCDGVGLGKTFVGLMLIERLVVRDRKNVILLAPKGAVESVWKPGINHYLRKLSGGAFSNLFVAAHTDLGLEKTREAFEAAKDRAHAIIIDEAHHFRNPGPAGTGLAFLDAPRGRVPEGQLFAPARRSRYRELFDVIPSPGGSRKQVFMLTATPINNSFHDLRHMIELFTQKQEDHFARRLGIHSLTAHFKRMEARLDGSPADGGPLLTDNEEARQIMAADPLVGALVVQRSRAFVKEKQQKAGAPVTAFPPREPPHRVDYSLQKVYGELLGKLEKAFQKGKPLFTLPMYYPLFYSDGAAKDIDPGEENRQEAVVALIRTAFLKRFESSVSAFRSSCDRLLVKLLGWATANAQDPAEKAKIAEWRQTNVKLVEEVRKRQPNLFNEAAGDDSDNDEGDEDVAEEEFARAFEALPRDEYDVGEMIDETINDLKQLSVFYAELNKFDHRNDDKLKKLLKMLRDDPALSTGKVLIFTEFADTADYLLERLRAAKVAGVERIDSRTSGRDRLAVIKRFSPYYNGSSSADLADRGLDEIRVLISTDVLSEGLNLQDGARLINYDLHWNPVRLMQRIGRVDRRRNPEVEARLAADHPDQAETRKVVAFYNFLPPEELNKLLTLYNRVTRKTLRISRALGIEGKKLLKEDDDYHDLQQFNETYEGKKSAMELLELERDELFRADPSLEGQLKQFPLRVFSGKAHPSPGTKAVFFCYRLPVFRDGDWTTDGGPCRWLLATLPDGTVIDEPTAIADVVRSIPLTPRVTVMEQPALSEIRRKVETQMKNTILKSLQVPLDRKPVLKAWMELN